METTLKIYQIKDIRKTIYAFRSYHKDVFNFKDYKKVFESTYTQKEFKVEDDLEHIFEMGNNGLLKTLNFNMSSISVSDIIVIGKSAWYVNVCGFQLLGNVEEL